MTIALLGLKVNVRGQGQTSKSTSKVKTWSVGPWSLIDDSFLVTDKERISSERFHWLMIGIGIRQHKTIKGCCTLDTKQIAPHQQSDYKTTSTTRSIWKMLSPFATVSRRMPIHQVSLLLQLSHAACALMSTTTTTPTTTTTTCDRGDRYGPIEWAQWNHYRGD